MERPSSAGRSASSGTPGWSARPATTTAPGGACRWAAATSGSPAGSSVTTAISYGPESSASPTVAAYPVNRACRPTIGATVDRVVSAASRYRVSPLNAAYATSAATIADRPDGVALSVGSAGRVTSRSASSAVS